LPAGEQRRVPVELAQILTPEHRDQPREFRFEAIHCIGLVDTGNPEVQWQGARGHPDSDPPAVTRLEPGDLLGNESRGPQREQEWRGGGPPRRVCGQDKGSHLQGLRQVAGEATVVLARHDSVEAAVEGEAGLCAELADDGVGGKLVVRVQPDGDRPRGEWCGGKDGS
jgi:hypothetical protein